VSARLRAVGLCSELGRRSCSHRLEPTCSSHSSSKGRWPLVPPKTTMLPPGSIRHAECAARPAGTLPAMSTSFLRVQRGASSPPCTSLHLPARATGPACVQPVHAARPRWQVHATRRGGGELGVPAAVAALRRGHFSRPGFAPRAVIVHVEPGILVVDLRRALAPCRTPEEDDAPLDRRGRVEGAAGRG